MAGGTVKMRRTASMKNMKISTRLNISILLFLLPLATLLYFYTGEIAKQIDFAVQEKKGNDHLRATVKALDLAADHYTLKLRIENGDASAMAQWAAATDKLTQAFEEIKTVDERLGIDLQFTEEGLKTRKRENYAYAVLRDKWNAIASSEPKKIKNEQYDVLIEGLRGMITHAGDTSNLILDPDLDTYYLMDVILAALPNTIVRIAESERIIYGLLTADRALTQEELSKIETYAAMLEQDDHGRVDGDMQTVYNDDPNFYGANPTLHQGTDDKLAQYDAATATYVNTLHGMVKNVHVNALVLLERSEAADKTAYNFWVAATDELDNMLQMRIDYFIAQRNEVMLVFAAVLAVAFAFYWYVTSGIKTSLKKLQTAMVEIADGKLDYPVPCLDLKDEIGNMARTLEIFKETSIEAQKMEDEKRKDQEQKLMRQKYIEQLIHDFDSKASNLLNNVMLSTEKMHKSVENMSGMAKQTTDKTVATMSATKETSGNVSAIAAAAEELSAAISEISQQVARSASITRAAVEKTRDTDGTVNQLTNAAQSIGAVVTLISDIAEQINMLALNATIESARAGDAGKGFAVVATEVKQLASQTSKATESISTQIAEVQGIVGLVVNSLTGIRTTIDEINGIASTIAAAVEEQGAATKEIAMNIQRTSDRVREVSGNVTEVGSMAVSTNDNARNVMDSVRDFSQKSKTLQQEVEGFLSSIAKS